jgi:hypothetical protein
MTLHPGIPLRREKGKPEGYAVTGNTRKPWVAEKGLVLYNAAGQNNSNLTLLTALVVNGEWELILVMSSHYCFYTPHQIFIVRVPLPSMRILVPFARKSICEA